MREEIITFTTAKLAKEKGFNIPVLYAFDDSDGLLTSSYCNDVFSPLNYNTSGYKHSRPTQSLLQKWLREEHNINIMPPLYFSGKGYLCSVVSIPKTKFYKTYEQALENELQEALKLI